MDTLDKYLLRHQDLSFDWSKKNCGHFASGWVLENEGVDPLANTVFPSDPEGVAEIVREYGSVEGMVTALLGRSSFSPAYAVRGDLVLAMTPQSAEGVGAMVGICNGSTAVFLREGSGVITFRMRVVSCAWRVLQC